MISTVLAITLMVVQLPAAGPRQEFASCLRAFMTAKLEARMEPPAFETELASACSAQENAYRTAYIQAATRTGDSRTMATQDAELEVEDLRANILELFRGSQPESRR